MESEYDFEEIDENYVSTGIDSLDQRFKTNKALEKWSRKNYIEKVYSLKIIHKIVRMF